MAQDGTSGLPYLSSGSASSTDAAPKVPSAKDFATQEKEEYSGSGGDSPGGVSSSELGPSSPKGRGATKPEGVKKPQTIDEVRAKLNKMGPITIPEETYSGSGSDTPKSATLPAISERHAAFLERKKERRNKRNQGPLGKMSSSTVDTHGFLSNLPEVLADVAYRFSFTVMGVSATKVVEIVCGEEVAKSMNVPPSQLSGIGVQDYRTLCHVPFVGPQGLDKIEAKMYSSDVPKLAKLLFTPISPTTDIPVCRTRFEALSSALVYVLKIDPTGDEDSFQRQLIGYENVVTDLHYRPKPLRPARAVLLFREGDGSADEEGWESILENYEVVEENLKKFGPVSLSDCMEMHAVFGRMASTRITRGETSAGDESDGSQDSDAPPNYEAERDPDWYGSQEPIGDIPEENLFGDVGGAALLQSSSSRDHMRHSWLSPMQRGAA